MKAIVLVGRDLTDNFSKAAGAKSTFIKDYRNMNALVNREHSASTYSIIAHGSNINWEHHFRLNSSQIATATLLNKINAKTTNGTNTFLVSSCLSHMVTQEVGSIQGNFLLCTFAHEDRLSYGRHNDEFTSQAICSESFIKFAADNIHKLAATNFTITYKLDNKIHQYSLTLSSQHLNPTNLQAELQKLYTGLQGFYSDLQKTYKSKYPELFPDHTWVENKSFTSSELYTTYNYLEDLVDNYNDEDPSQDPIMRVVHNICADANLRDIYKAKLELLLQNPNHDIFKILNHAIQNFIDHYDYKAQKWFDVVLANPSIQTIAAQVISDKLCTLIKDYAAKKYVAGNSNDNWLKAQNEEVDAGSKFFRLLKHESTIVTACHLQAPGQILGNHEYILNHLISHKSFKFDAASLEFVPFLYISHIARFYYKAQLDNNESVIKQILIHSSLNREIQDVQTPKSLEYYKNNKAVCKLLLDKAIYDHNDKAIPLLLPHAAADRFSIEMAIKNYKTAIATMHYPADCNKALAILKLLVNHQHKDSNGQIFIDQNIDIQLAKHTPGSHDHSGSKYDPSQFIELVKNRLVSSDYLNMFIYNNPKALKLVLKYINVSEKNVEFAIKHDKLEALKQLLDYTTGTSYLKKAIEYNKPKAVKLLLTKGNVTSDTLDYAIRKGDEQLIKLLLTHQSTKVSFEHLKTANYYKQKCLKTLLEHKSIAKDIADANQNHQHQEELTSYNNYIEEHPNIDIIGAEGVTVCCA